MESLAKRSKQDFELSRTVPKGFIRSYRFSPGNYVIDVPSLFQEIFQLLISLMITQLEHMQFKVSVSVQVKRKCVFENPILVWTALFPFVQAELSRDDGDLATPYFRSRQKIVLSEGDIESAIESCQTDITARLDSWVCFLSCVCSFTFPLWFCFWFFIFLDFEWIELEFKTCSQGLRWFRGVQTLDGKQLRRFAAIHQVKKGLWNYFECILFEYLSNTFFFCLRRVLMFRTETNGVFSGRCCRPYGRRLITQSVWASIPLFKKNWTFQVCVFVRKPWHPHTHSPNHCVQIYLFSKTPLLKTCDRVVQVGKVHPHILS